MGQRAGLQRKPPAVPRSCIQGDGHEDVIGSPSNTAASSTMRQCQFSAAFRSLACQSRTRVPTHSRRSTLPATQVVRKRAQLALGATHVGGSPPTSARGRNSKPDATFHPARWAAQAAKRISRDPPRPPRDRHRPEPASRPAVSSSRKPAFGLDLTLRAPRTTEQRLGAIADRSCTSCDDDTSRGCARPKCSCRGLRHSHGGCCTAEFAHA